jgi:xylan 1,4-beta-xylosidase
MLTIQGINKPVFYAYQFLNRLGNIELENKDESSIVTKNNKGDIQALVWDFTNTHPGDSTHNQKYYIRDLPSKQKGSVKLQIAQVAEGDYALEIYKVGYRSNDAYSTYLSMGKPSQLTKQQVDQIKKQNDGSPFVNEIIHVKSGSPFLYQLDVRENDVFLLKLLKL